MAISKKRRDSSFRLRSIQNDSMGIAAVVSLLRNDIKSKGIAAVAPLLCNGERYK